MCRFDVLFEITCGLGRAWVRARVDAETVPAAIESARSQLDGLADRARAAIRYERCLVFEVRS